MKFLKITNVFSEHWQQLETELPELSSMSWSEQQVIVSKNWFGYPHVWKYALEPLGYEVIELFGNVDLLLETWAKERGLDDYVNELQTSTPAYPLREGNIRLKVIEAQILYEQPDVVFVADLFGFSDSWLKGLREKCGSIKLIVGWYGAALFDASILKACDLILSCIPEMVEELRAAGHKSEHIHHAFEPRVLEKIDRHSKPSIDLSFIGNIRRHSLYDLERDYILEKLSSQVNIQIYSKAALIRWGMKNELRFLARDRAYSTAKALRTLGVPDQVLNNTPILKKVAAKPSRPTRKVNPKLKPSLRPPVYGLQMFRTLQASLATFNNHVAISPRSASNMRLFEATGTGTCLVTDHKKNLHELFEPDKEVVTYQSAEECVEKVKWLMAHPTECRAIAKAGQARTLKEHTLNKRATVMDILLKKYL